MQNRREELHIFLENHKGVEEILNDIKCITEMVLHNDYDKDKIIKIEDKYSVETKFLLEFENPYKFGFEDNEDDPALQVLINLRDRLYLIAVYKVLKEEGKEIPKDFLSKKYPELIELINN